MATSAGALQSVNGASAGGGTGGGSTASPAAGGPVGGGAGSELPAAMTGGLSTGSPDTTGAAGTAAAPSGRPGGVVGAMNSLGAAVSYTFAGIPIGVVVVSLLALIGGTWGLSAWVRRLAAFRGEAQA